jgi:hypothetical protein
VRRAGYRGGHRGIGRHREWPGSDVPDADGSRHRGDPAHARGLSQISRHLVLRRFPYGVFYVLDGQSISIVAVLNLRQDPTAIRATLG